MTTKPERNRRHTGQEATICQTGPHGFLITGAGDEMPRRTRIMRAQLFATSQLRQQWITKRGMPFASPADRSPSKADGNTAEDLRMCHPAALFM